MSDMMEVTGGETISRWCGSGLVNSTSFGDLSSVVNCYLLGGYQGNPFFLVDVKILTNAWFQGRLLVHLPNQTICIWCCIGSRSVHSRSRVIVIKQSSQEKKEI